MGLFTKFEALAEGRAELGALGIDPFAVQIEKIISPTEGIALSFQVKNTGDRRGQEVVQLYLEDVVSSVATPVKELRGFAKLDLAPGETKTCTFKLTPDDLALFDANLKRVVEPGQFNVMIGASSEDIRLKGKFHVK